MPTRKYQERSGTGKMPIPQNYENCPAFMQRPVFSSSLLPSSFFKMVVYCNYFQGQQWEHLTPIKRRCSSPSNIILAGLRFFFLPSSFLLLQFVIYGKVIISYFVS
ncbi:MAG: hypothetical protein F6K39_01375 [Okeania sp. SIO3B3]|nr:hypothetical protein [Okeania sp. SIO3B3]